MTTIRLKKSIQSIFIGSQVLDGGHLKAQGEKIVLTGGFSVQRGGSLSINANVN